MKKRLYSLLLAAVVTVTTLFSSTIEPKAASVSVSVTNLHQMYDDDNEISMEWDAPEDTYSLIKYKPVGQNNWSTYEYGEEVGYGSSYANIGNLTYGTSYDVKVENYSDENYQHKLSDTNIVEMVTKPKDYEPGFSIYQTNTSQRSITVNWTPYPGANYYNVRYYVDNDKKELNTSNTSFVINNPKANQLINVFVTPYRRSNTGYLTMSAINNSIGEIATLPELQIESASIVKKTANIYCNSAYGDGFEYEIRKVKGNKKVKTVNSKDFSISCSNKTFKSSELFKVRVRGYVTSQGKKYYGNWSQYSYFSRQDVVKSVKNKKSKGIEVKWNKINGASGYNIYASTKYDSGYKLVATAKKGNVTKATFKKFNKKALKNNKKYYVCVKPYFKSNGKKYEIKTNTTNVWGMSVKYKK